MAFGIESLSKPSMVLIRIVNKLGMSELPCLAANLCEYLEKQPSQARIYISFNLDEFPLSLYTDFPLVQLLSVFAEIYRDWHASLELKFLLVSPEPLVPLACYIAENLALPLHVFSCCEALNKHLRAEGLNCQAIS